MNKQKRWEAALSFANTLQMAARTSEMAYEATKSTANKMGLTVDQYIAAASYELADLMLRAENIKESKHQ